MSEMRGFTVEAGTYVLLSDVANVLREYARESDSLAVAAAADWLEGKQEPEPEVYGAEEDDVSPGVERIEIYPDPPDDPRPKWYARSIDTGGYVLKTTSGSYDQEWVIRNAEERWPGIPVFLLKNAGEDSKWTEDGTRGVFPSKGPPIRRLYAGVQ